MSATRPRLLLVAPRSPYPLTAGYRFRLHGLARLLAERYRVDLLCLDAVAADSPAPFDALTAFPSRPERRAFRAARWMLAGLPLQVGGYVDGRAAAWLRASSAAYDACLFFQVRTAPYIETAGRPAILDYVDAISMHYRESKAAARGLWRLFYALEGERLRDYERAVLGRVCGAFVASPADRAYLLDRAGGPAPLEVLPTAVHPETLGYPPAAEEPGWIVMTGRMAYYPNQDAAVRFAREVFPVLRRRDPRLRFFIVGADPPPVVRRLARLPGVEVTGYVEEPAAFVARAQVVVAPVRMGAGLQTKVLEGMALARPVVATPLAVRGVEGGADGVHFVVAEGTEAMVEAVWGLLRDEPRRRGLGEAARRLILERYTWDAVRARLFAAMDRWL